MITLAPHTLIMPKFDCRDVEPDDQARTTIGTMKIEE
jgi:hypothetical protein